MNSKFDHEKVFTTEQKRILTAYRKRLDQGKVHTVAIDGLDGSGKRTLARSLSKMLNNLGHDIIIASYPTYELPFGEMLYKMLNTTHLKLSEKSRILLYGLNRAETAFNIMRKANLLCRRGKTVYVLFDRYWSSSLVTKSYVMYKKGQSDITDSEMSELLQFMQEVDYWLISLLLPDKSPVFIPVVNAEQADSAMSDRRWKKDEYEQSPVQDIAGNLYKRASNNSEIDLRLIEQFDPKNPGKRLSPSEVAQKVYDQIDCEKGTGKGKFHIMIYRDDLMSANLIKESSHHFKEEVEELKRNGYWPDIYLKDISAISREYQKRQEDLLKMISVKENLIEIIPKKERNKIEKHLDELDYPFGNITFKLKKVNINTALLQMPFLKNEFLSGGLLKSAFPIRVITHVCRSHFAPHIPKVEERKVPLPEREMEFHPEPYLEKLLGKDECSYGKFRVSVVPIIYRVGTLNKLELLMGKRHIRSLKKWKPKGLVPLSEEVFIERTELLPFHSDPSKELYRFERLLWDYNGGLVNFLPEITNNGQAFQRASSNLRFNYMEEKPYTMETLYYTLVRGLLEELTGIDIEEMLMQGGVAEIPNVRNALDRTVKKFIRKYKTNILSTLYENDQKIYSNYRILPLFEQLLGAYIDVSAGEPWLCFVIALPALGNLYEKSFLKSKDWQRKMGSEPLWVSPKSPDIVDDGPRTAVSLINKAYEQKGLPFLKSDYYAANL